MSRNEYAFLAVIAVTFVVVAFSSGYWLGSISQSNSNEDSILELEAKLDALESRMTEQLLIIPNAVPGLQFEIINLGNTTVSLSDIRINDIINDTSPGWIIQNDNTLLAGETSEVTVYPEKYLTRITGTLIFSFKTTKGNIYYSVLSVNQETQDGFEQLELPSVYAQAVSGGWNITIDIKNTGSADATLSNIFINSIPIQDYSENNIRLYVDGIDVSTSLYTTGVLVAKGKTVAIIIQFIQDGSVGFTAGTRIEIKLHTAAGIDYPTSIKLP
jgi:hypothetical protein